jgi:predicted transcriptional regulator
MTHQGNGKDITFNRLMNKKYRKSIDRWHDILDCITITFIIKYRSRTDITAQILEAANGGATKTKIMYKAFLSYQPLKEYLRVLVENGLLEYEKETQTFKTTDKGKNLLKCTTK